MSALALSRRIWREAREYWGHLVLAFLLSSVSLPIVLLTPVPLKLAVDSVVDAKPLPPLLAHLLPAGWAQEPRLLLLLACALSFAFILLQNLHGYLSWIYQRFIAEDSIVGMRAKLFAHVQRLSLVEHDRTGVAELFYCLQNDVAAMQYVIVGGFLPFFTSLATFLAMLVVTLRLDWRFGAIGVAVVPLLTALSRWHSPRSRVWWTAVKESERDAIARIQESLGAMRVVKAFGREDRERTRYRMLGEKNVTLHLGAAWRETAYGMGVAMVVAAASAFALYLGISHVRGGDLSLGNFLVVMAYLALLLKPMETLGKQVSTIQTALAGAERVFRLFERRAECLSVPTRTLSSVRGAIELCAVTHEYEPGRAALRDISLSIAPGQHIGIAGPTGAGKTTLIHLLMRLVEPTSGIIRLDGIDVRELDPAELRRQFSLVLQEPVLFSATIEENIAYALDGATREQIEQAAKAAQVHDFISGLPRGYQTQVGERGLSLSGGERQRIAIARAFLKNAPVLILDEPTSSVDEKNEAMIAEALAELKRGRTTLTISHRPALLKGCDQVVYLERGRVVQKVRPHFA